MGTKKAAMVVAHKILVAIFHMFQRGIAFVDLGGNYLDGINKISYGQASRPTPPFSATRSCFGLKLPHSHQHRATLVSSRTTI